MTYYVVNGNTGEVHSQYEDYALAEETQNRLNRELPYGEFEYYMVMDEPDYAYFTGKSEKIAPIYSVYGVGKESDAYPPMDDLVMAKSPSEARKHFEEKHPAYKAVDAYQVG